jgi:hypothetical protein
MTTFYFSENYKGERGNASGVRNKDSQINLSKNRNPEGWLPALSQNHLS